MSLSFVQEPAEIVPVNNKIIYTGVSSNVATTGFRYAFKITDLATSEYQEYYQLPRPSGYFLFDASAFAKQYVNSYLPMNTYGWQVNTGMKKFKVEFGEDFGVTSPSYLNTKYFHAWDGIVKYDEFPSYDLVNYVFGSNISSESTITNKCLNDKTFLDKSNYINAIGYDQYDIDSLTIITYDSSGSIIQTLTKTNPYKANPNLVSRYNCIDVGWKGMDNISTVSSGTLPVITSSVAYYEVYIFDTVPSHAVNILVKRIYLERCERFPVSVVHFLSERGGFETLYFEKISEEVETKESKKVSVYPYLETSGHEYEYAVSTPTSKVIYTNLYTKKKMTTDWLSEDDVLRYKNLYASPLIYLDRGSEVDYIQLTCLQNSFLINKNYNNKLYQITMEFEVSGVNNRQ